VPSLFFRPRIGQPMGDDMRRSQGSGDDMRQVIHEQGIAIGAVMGIAGSACGFS